MNVVYIHTHDMGRWISPYDLPDAPTPALAAFAREATRFTQAFSAAPTCSPSRATLLTGQNAHQAGMLGLAHLGFRLSHPERHLAYFLRGHGYRTLLFGVQHESDSPAEIAGRYERVSNSPVKDYRDPAGFIVSDRANACAAADFLRSPEARQRPFFLSLGLFAPHRPFGDGDYARFSPERLAPPAPLPDTPAARRDYADYLSCIETADQAIGLVLQALRAGGYYDDTIIFVTTDHGPAMPGMKCTLSDHGIGVPLLWHQPGNPSAGGDCDALVSLLDVYPTVCDLLGLSRPDWLEGESLRPLVEGARAEVRTEVFAEVSYHAAYQPMRCIRTRTHKLIWHCEGDRAAPPANIDSGYLKAELWRAGRLKEAHPEFEFYDLETDPLEKVDRHGDPACAETERDLHDRLRAWMTRTGDPALGGMIPPPRGAKVTPADSLDPAGDPVGTPAFATDAPSPYARR